MEQIVSIRSSNKLGFGEPVQLVQTSAQTQVLLAKNHADLWVTDGAQQVRRAIGRAIIDCYCLPVAECLAIE